jgi:hypothetical protein
MWIRRACSRGSSERALEGRPNLDSDLDPDLDPDLDSDLVADLVAVAVPLPDPMGCRACGSPERDGVHADDGVHRRDPQALRLIASKSGKRQRLGLRLGPGPSPSPSPGPSPSSGPGPDPGPGPGPGPGPIGVYRSTVAPRATSLLPRRQHPCGSNGPFYAARRSGLIVSMPILCRAEALVQATVEEVVAAAAVEAQSADRAVAGAQAGEAERGAAVFGGPAQPLCRFDR